MRTSFSTIQGRRAMLIMTEDGRYEPAVEVVERKAAA
jgi:hypothetical protein